MLDSNELVRSYSTVWGIEVDLKSGWLKHPQNRVGIVFPAIASFVTTRDFERRPNARIVRSALNEIKAIQTLLSNVYRDAGDGRTLLRELVQNADDAEARRLKFAVVDRGLCNARNPLLRGPALIVANDGPFLT